MKLTKIPVTIAYLDSLRGRAYLNAFLKFGFCPQEIVVMENEFEVPVDFVNEARKYEYDKKYFDYTLGLGAVAGKETIVRRVSTNSINDPKVVEALAAGESQYVLFTGGGIVSPETLAIDKKFIHIHPGYVPFYRGSTCFYYSLIEKSELGATAFFMAEELDAGPILARNKYELNVLLEKGQIHFIDHILDPYIRMATLENVLLDLSKGDDLLATYPVYDSCSKEAYYVVHPIFRAVAWKKICESYDEAKPAGIISI